MPGLSVAAVGSEHRRRLLEQVRRLQHGEGRYEFFSHRLAG
ncbi:MAG TPA: hypothetical protein VGX16_05355 [Solirubrobacteraceae bacterium]|jgi:hypothetical protein|nr:hypothetical protein [Solirubrobacteraceae bacterium]